MSRELADKLVSAGLTGLKEDLRKAGIVDVFAFESHTIDELQSSLARPTVKGAKFELSPYERRKLLEAGLAGAATPSHVHAHRTPTQRGPRRAHSAAGAPARRQYAVQYIA